MKWPLLMFISCLETNAYRLERPFLQKNVMSLDTIYCGTENTSYLLFKDKVDLVDIGKPVDYVVQIEENAVFIKSKHNAPSLSTLLVKAGGNFYLGMLNWKSNNTNFFYPINTNPSNPIQSNQTSPNPSDTLSRNLGQLAGIDAELTTLGFITPYIEAGVVVIRNDNKYTYLKILLKNKSSIPYQLDFISFQYFQHMPKGTLRKGKKNAIDVFPAASPQINQVPPLTTKPLLYAIPSFGLAAKGYLLILFRERNGDRVLKIKIDGSELQRAPIIVQQ